MTTPPPPAIVPYNDWRRIPVAAAGGFAHALPVSVIVSYYEAPEALGRTLAALETQDWPRELFEVVIVDDGSRVPLDPPMSTSLDVRVVRQEHRGFGAARARNAGTRAAAHDILLFLDTDMLPESGWIAAHARWHHGASGLLTLGFRAHVSVDGVGADAIRRRPGTLKDLLAGRPADPSFVERHMTRTRELTSRDDDLFRVVVSANFGIRRELYETAGGFDESFTRWGAEDTEFGYRVYTLGGVLVPVREAFAWHQGRRAEGWERKERELRVQRLKVAHLIAQEDFRDARPGRSFTVPQYVVTVEAAGLPAERVVEAAERLLADRVHDLIVRIELPEGDPRLDWIREDFGADPRVRVGPARSALDEFPFAALHVAVPGGAAFAADLVHRLRCELGPAAAAETILDDGSMVSITRAWVLHRARRTGRPARDFGDVVTFPARTLRIGAEGWRHLQRTHGEDGRRLLPGTGRSGATRPGADARRPDGRSAGRPGERNMTTPAPAAVRYNDWPRIHVPSPDAFTPALPVSLIVSGRGARETLARILAALEAQDWPRELFEVIVVDDGSRAALEPPRTTPLTITMAHGKSHGCGSARARNAGVRAAAHDILLFLDGDMLPEAGWIAAHARWHHGASDLLTLGSGAPSFERRLAGTGELTSRDDGLFRVVAGANFGIRRELFETAGGFDESFTRQGAEDVEFGYRVHTLGGVLVPVRDALASRLRPPAEDRERTDRLLRMQRSRFAQRIAHEDFRDARPGRSFTVPRYVVTVETADLPAERVVETTERILADRAHDLIVRIEMPAEDPRLEWVREDLGPDPRVRVGPATSALDEFPFAALHVAVSAGATFESGLVDRLHCELGTAAAARAVLDDGSAVSIARAWLLHRARRTGRPARDLGDIITVPARTLRIEAANPPPFVNRAMEQHLRDLRARMRRVLVRMQRVRTPRHAWWFLQWLAGVALWWAARFVRPGYRRGLPPAVPPETAGPSGLPLGAEIAVLGPRARRVFESTRRVSEKITGRHVDLALADTPADAAPVDLQAVVLSQSPAQLSVPAFDPRVDNPIGWVRATSRVAGALGRLEHLPPGAEAQRVIDRRDRVGLRWIHHLEDVQAFHAGVVERAGELARLAANGVVVHLAVRDARLRPYLGAQLHDLMRTDVRGGDLAARQSLSIRMRRAALREHSLRSRARQICAAAGLPDPPRVPLVSILLATRRPALLPGILALIARQRYPRLELILALHGGGFGEAERHLKPLRFPWKIVRASARAAFGSVLNAAVAASTGTLLAKMDDDDLYDAEHIWDLVLAHEYSEAQIVGKGVECIYLAGADRTVHRSREGGERFFHPAGSVVGGGALLISRYDLERAGGWRRAPRHVDQALIEDVSRAGGRLYRTHGAGFALVRHGRRHTWEMGDDYFLERADEVREGWQPALAGLADVPPPAVPAGADGWSAGRKTRLGPGAGRVDGRSGARAAGRRRPGVDS